MAVGLGQAHDAQTSAVSHFGMRLALEDGAHGLCGRRARSGLGPMDEPRRCPLEMRLVTLGHVFAQNGVLVGSPAARMRGDAFAVVEDLNRCRGEARFQLLPGELVRDTVVVAIDFDVVIDVGANGFPTGDHVAFGGQRLENGPVDFREARSARAFAFAERPVIQLVQQRADGLIQVR